VRKIIAERKRRINNKRKKMKPKERRRSK